MDILEKILKVIYSWALTTGIKIVIGFVILWVGLKVIKKISHTIKLLSEKRGFDPTVTSFLDGLMNVGLKILLVLIVMNYIGLATSGIIALLGSAGLAIGLSLKDGLANFAGGVILLFIRPFNVGDFIEGAGETGRIEKIGIFYTQMLTIDNKVVLIPNGTIANGIVTNYTSQDRRRVDLKFSVSYDEDVRRVKKILYEVVNSEELVLRDPEPFVAVCEHADSSVNFIVKAWTKTDDYWTVYYDLLEKVKIRFDDEKIIIPYPQMDIHLKREETDNGMS